MRPFVAPTLTALACAALLLGAGCAPPDPVLLVDTGVDEVVVDGDPSVAILYPERDENGQIRIELTEDCAIRQLFVLDVDNFELSPPTASGNVEGEGHVHVAFGEDYDATSSPVMVFERTNIDASSPLVPASFGFIRVSLQENDHTDIEHFPHWQDEAEYYVVDPSGACL